MKLSSNPSILAQRLQSSLTDQSNYSSFPYSSESFIYSVNKFFNKLFIYFYMQISQDCLVIEHKNQPITHLCVYKECLNDSRWTCGVCL